MHYNWQPAGMSLISLCMWVVLGCIESPISFHIADAGDEISTTDDAVDTETESNSVSDGDDNFSTDTSIDVETNCTGSATYVFTQGLSGYLGTKDVELVQQFPDASHPSNYYVSTDFNDGFSQQQVLIKFNGIFGIGENKVPAGASVRKATLQVYGIDSSLNAISIFQMLRGWSESATWNSMSGGIQTDDAEASAEADDTLIAPIEGVFHKFDVTESVRSWAESHAVNHGFAILNSGSDGFDFYTSEHGFQAQRPTLTIEIGDCETTNNG